MMPRQQWTDERLDHFERRVDERFDRVDERFDSIDEKFKLVDKRFEQVDKRLDRVETDLSELRGAVLGIQRVMAQGFIAMCTVMVGGFAAVFGAIAL